MTEERREHLRKIRLANPIRYWLGKKRPELQSGTQQGDLWHQASKTALASLKGTPALKRSDAFKQKRREYIIKNQPIVQKNTKIEIMMEGELRRRLINFQSQVPMGRISIVDFYLPDEKVIIYVDSDYWHKLRSYRIRDWKQNRHFRTLGFAVYRFWEFQVKAGVGHCVDSITELRAPLALPSPKNVHRFVQEIRQSGKNGKPCNLQNQ